MVDASTNYAAFDIWTVVHAASGFIAARAGVDLAAAIWGALAIEAIEIGLSGRYPDLAHETRANQLTDIAAFLGAYTLGST